MTSATILALAFVVVRPRLKLTRAAAAPIVAIGAFEIAGNQLFSVAANLGYLSVASVLSSIYPVFVIALAYIFSARAPLPRAAVGSRGSACRRGPDRRRLTSAPLGAHGILITSWAAGSARTSPPAASREEGL